MPLRVRSISGTYGYVALERRPRKLVKGHWCPGPESSGMDLLRRFWALVSTEVTTRAARLAGLG